MLRSVFFAALILALSFDFAGAQSLSVRGQMPEDRRQKDTDRVFLTSGLQPLASDPARRDSLWNGTLIGLGAGIGSAMALDAVFCENGFGGCDTPWAAYLTLGGIGAAAGAGIDFLIGRNRTSDRADGGHTTLKVRPLVGRDRKGLSASLRF